MATSEETRGWPKTKASIADLAEAFQKISEVADRENREDEAELQQLRLRAANFDDIQRENDRLRSELEKLKRKKSTRTIPASDDESSEECSPLKKVGVSRGEDEEKEYVPDPKASMLDLFKELGSRSVAVQTEDSDDEEFPDTVPPKWNHGKLDKKYNAVVAKYKRSQEKYNALEADHNSLKAEHDKLETEHDHMNARAKELQKNHAALVEARGHLERRVRHFKDACSEMTKYADRLEIRYNKAKTELATCPHGHRDVLNSRRPQSLALGTSRNLTPGGNLDSDDITPRRPSRTNIFSSPIGRSRMNTPVSAMFDPRAEKLRSSPPISVNASTRLSSGSRTNQHQQQVVPSNEPGSPPRLSVAHAAPSTPRAQTEPEISHPDENFTNEEMLPLDSLEVEQQLPTLKDDDKPDETQESNHTSSTQGEPYPTQQPVAKPASPIIKLDGSSPILIKTKRVRKTRSRNANTSNEATKSVVKMEDITSSPVASTPALQWEASMDLDDHPHMVTPRKRPAPKTSHRAPSVAREPQRDRITKPVPEPLQPTWDLAKDDSEDEDLLLLDGPSNNDGSIPKSTSAPASIAILVERSPDKPARNANALQPLSTNKRILRGTRDGQPPQKRQRRDQLPTSILEDRENLRDSIEERRAVNNRKGLGLFSDPLEKPAFRSNMTSPRTILRAAKSAQRSNLTPGTSPQLSRPSSREGSLAAMRLSKMEARPRIASSGDIFDPPSSSPPRAQPAPTIKLSKPPKKKSPVRHDDDEDDGFDDRPENEPLRARPVNRLTLNDFKINPVYNQGHTHAFTEVVRRRADRKCLPGCSASCCAPSFRRLAAITIAGRLDPSDPSILASDQAAIEEYLGDEYPKFDYWSEGKQKETLELAIARRLAMDHGRHRDRWGKEGSPPGFWDVDFPETQELREIRVESERRVRGLVEERFREACRPGGKFVFRDE